MYEKSEYWRGINNSKAREAWATFLASYSWDAWFTSTSASRIVRRHPISLCGKVQDMVFAISPITVQRFFVAAEEFALGDWHCHGLVKWFDLDTKPLGYPPLLEFATGLSKIGYSRVERANSIVAVSEYVSKYVIKDSPWEYNIAGTGWALGNGGTIDIGRA